MKTIERRAMSGLPKQCPSCGGFCGTTPCSYGEASASGSNELLCVDRGTWTVSIDGGRYVIDSDDFTHDVRIEFSGDFADNNDSKEYAEHIAKRLNSTIDT